MRMSKTTLALAIVTAAFGGTASLAQAASDTTNTVTKERPLAGTGTTEPSENSAATGRSSTTMTTDTKPMTTDSKPMTGKTMGGASMNNSTSGTATGGPAGDTMAK